MRLYRGQIYLAGSIIAALCVAMMSSAFIQLVAQGDAGRALIVLGVGIIAALVALVMGTLAYSLWVPKWERIEKRTGRQPGVPERKR